MKDATIDAVLASLKFVSILIAGILGSIGLLVNYKDDQGRITKWGRRALIGVITASLVAAVIQGVEVYKQREASKRADDRQQEENEKQRQTLLGLSRAVYPLFEHKELYLDIDATIPLNEPGIRGYKTRLDNTIRAMIHKHQYSSERENIRIEPIRAINADPQHPDREPQGFMVTFTPTASLFPRRTEGVAWRAFHGFSIQVDLFRKPLEATEYLNGAKSTPPDLSFHPIANSYLRMRYELGDSKVTVTSWKMIVNEDEITNPSHLSLMELSGAQLFIQFWEDDSLWSPEDDSDQVIESYSRVQRDSKIIYFGLHISGNRYAGVLHNQLLHPESPIYVCTLPNNLIEVDAKMNCEK